MSNCAPDATPKREPKVSVIVPALDSARVIRRCMASLGAQMTHHAYEVIVVHSGTDDTCELAREALPRVRTIQLAERALAARARAVGVEAARGEILAFVDSDVYVAAGWLDEVVRSAESGYDLICGSIGNANPGSRVSRAEQLVMFSELLVETPERPIWFAPAGNLVMPRSTYERFGPFVETRAAEDLLFSRRLVMAGGRILFRPALHVLHDNRRRLGPFLRNQWLLGAHTAIARRLVPFADSSSRALFCLLLPVAPLAKLGKIALRLARWCPGELFALARSGPLVLLGVVAYGAGQVIGALSPRPALLARLDETPIPAAGVGPPLAVASPPAESGLRLSIVVPAFNEAARLPPSLRRIVAYLSERRESYEIIVVDDGSADATATLARVALAPLGERGRVLENGKNLGKGASVRRGMLAAGGARVLFSDADLSTPIEELEQLEAALERGADVAIGSRALDRTLVEQRQPWPRELVGRVFNRVVRALAVPGIRDTQCGFKLFARAAVEPIFSRARIDRFGFDIEALALAQHLGLTVEEVPVRWRNAADSRVTLAQGAAAFLDPLRVQIGLRLGRYGSGDDLGSAADRAPSFASPASEPRLGAEPDVVSRAETALVARGRGALPGARASGEAAHGAR